RRGLSISLSETRTLASVALVALWCHVVVMDLAMSAPVRAPCGTWVSPLTAEIVSAAALRLGGVILDDEDIYWIEARPEEGGRNVVVKRSAGGRVADVTPAGTNVRTRVHEYGGGAYTVQRGTLYFAEFADQRLYKLDPGPTPAA